MDQNAAYRKRKPQFEIERFYGQLQNILVVKLPAARVLGLKVPTTLILAGIRCCPVVATNTLEMPFYTNPGRFEVVDITSVQCLVGRIQVGNLWAIIDRSGSLGGSYYAGLGDE